MNLWIISAQEDSGEDSAMKELSRYCKCVVWELPVFAQRR